MHFYWYWSLFFIGLFLSEIHFQWFVSVFKSSYIVDLIYMLWEPFSTLTLLNSSQHRLQLSINDNNHRNVWEIVIVLSPCCFFFNGSLTGGLIKSGHQNIISTIQCHPNALCLKYNIYAVCTVNEIRKQKCQETDKECRASQATGSAMRLSSSVNLKNPVLCLECIAFLENTFTRHYLVSHRPLRNIIFTCISFRCISIMDLRLKNDSMST